MATEKTVTPSPDKVARQLKGKAINLKGKEYVQVADRVTYFNDTYTNGCIETEVISSLDTDFFVIKAIVTPDCLYPNRKFTGHSRAVIGDGMVNKTSAIENAETSAVGRALGLMGIGVIESIASADEMNKALGSDGSRPAYAASPSYPKAPYKPSYGQPAAPAQPAGIDYFKLLKVKLTKMGAQSEEDAIDLISKYTGINRTTMNMTQGEAKAILDLWPAPGSETA